MNLFQYFNIILSCIPEELINILLSFKNGSTQTATVGLLEKQNTNISYRNTEWINLPDYFKDQIKFAIYNLYDNHLKNIYQQKIKFIEVPQFLFYNTGGKYDIHNDSEDFSDGRLKRICDRDITVLIYLNDDYEGGELELPAWGIKIKPKPGTVICFPSYFEFSHRVLPVTSGRRYNIVSWICTEERIYHRPYNI